MTAIVFNSLDEWTSFVRSSYSGRRRGAKE